MSTILLTGLPASQGIARGVVRVVTGADDTDRFQEGEILVTRITDPTMVMMMNCAGAIVTDIGGITSHPAILSREMGIPCVVNTKNATTLLKEGMMVEVDGTKGEVRSI